MKKLRIKDSDYTSHILEVLMGWWNTDGDLVVRADTYTSPKDYMDLAKRAQFVYDTKLVFWYAAMCIDNRGVLDFITSDDDMWYFDAKKAFEKRIKVTHINGNWYDVEVDGIRYCGHVIASKRVVIVEYPD